MTTRSEAELLATIAEMVAHGEYLDDVPGIPGVALTGGGTFQRSAGGPMRRTYTRGAEEHLRAKRQGLVDRLPPLAVAHPADIAEAEATLGLPLPSLLRRLYLEVGNRELGPGYGILGLRNGNKDRGGVI